MISKRDRTANQRKEFSQKGNDEELRPHILVYMMGHRSHPQTEEYYMSATNSSNQEATEMMTKHFEAVARVISYQATILGGCNGQRDDESWNCIADCERGNGGAPCKDAVFDRQRAEKKQTMLDDIIRQISSTPPDTPRFRALEKERRGLEN